MSSVSSNLLSRLISNYVGRKRVYKEAPPLLFSSLIVFWGGRARCRLLCQLYDSLSFTGQTFSLRQLGICEPPPRRGLALCPETGLSHPLSSYPRGPAVTENHEPVSPERTMALWGTGAKSGQNSCLSSRSNSALTLTDTEMDNKSDTEMGE